MASSSLKRGSPIEALWDHCKHKVFGIVMSGHLVGTEKSNPYCKIYCGKTTLKLSGAKKTCEPQWNELFYFEPSEQDIIKVEVWDEKRLSDSFIGELNLGTVLQLSKEKVIDGWYALVGKKEQSTSAKIHLRLYYSTMPGTAPAKGYYHHAFMYGGVANRIKSGDLIGYSGAGVIATSTKLQSNCEYSSLGVVVELANKWTEEPELYVVEVDRTRGVGVIDALADKRKDGICIFRLFERIHAFYGKAIWWVPRKEPLSNAQQQQLASFVLRAHSDPSPFDRFPSVPIANFLHSMGLAKDPSELVEAYSPLFVASLLKSVDPGIIQNKAGVMTPVAIAALPVFDKPVLVRKMAAAPRASSIVYTGEEKPTAIQEPDLKGRSCDLKVLSTSKYARLTESEERSAKKEETEEETMLASQVGGKRDVFENTADEAPPPFEESEAFVSADPPALAPMSSTSSGCGLSASQPGSNLPGSVQQTPLELQQQLYLMQMQMQQMQMQMQMTAPSGATGLPYGSPFAAMAMQSVQSMPNASQSRETPATTELHKVVVHEPPRQPTLHQLELGESLTATR